MEANGQEETPKWFEEYLNRQDDRLESIKGYMMVTATVLAGLSFQIIVNPPGGVWQGDACNSIENQTCIGIPGTAVLEYVSSKRRAYLIMVKYSILSFYVSMSIIFIVVTGAQLRNLTIIVILSSLMGIAITATTLVFHSAVQLVQFEDKNILGFLAPFPLLFLLLNLISFAFYFVRVIRIGCQRRQGTHQRMPPQGASPAP